MCYLATAQSYVNNRLVLFEKWSLAVKLTSPRIKLATKNLSFIRIKIMIKKIVSKDKKK